MELVLDGLAPNARSRGAREGRGGEGRSGDPVRRHSRPRGRFEGVFWRPFKPRDVARYLTAAERFERGGKKPGDRSGPLGTVAIEVLRELLRLVDYRSGRLEPALLTIMARVKRSKDAVVRALKALRRHGFVDWIRRWEPTGQVGPGPQVKQASNAYRLALPPAAERLLGRSHQDAPVPDDHAHAIEQRAAERRAQLAKADVEERHAAQFGAGPLADAMARFEAAVQRRQRESARRSESGQKS